MAQIPLASAARGHQLKVFLPPEYRITKIECTCGWSTTRQKVVRVQGKKSRKVDETMVEFRGRGHRHIYDVWRDAQQERIS